MTVEGGHPLTVITGSQLVAPTWFWYPAHLALELALSVLLPKEREELLIPHDSLPELTLAFVHTSVPPPIQYEEQEYRA